MDDYDETSEDGTDFEDDLTSSKSDEDGDDISGAGVRCLSALTVTAALEPPYGNVATPRERQVLEVFELRRDQAGVQKARTPEGWLHILDGSGTGLMVEMLGPHAAWVEVKGYDEFVQWVNQTNVSKAEAEAGARSDSLLSKALAAMQEGQIVTKYDMRKRGSGGAKARMIWLSDDLATLKWGDARKLAKGNALDQGSAGTPSSKSDRETSTLEMASVEEVVYGRDGSDNFKKHGYPAPSWLCFTVRTNTRTYDFSAASSAATRTAVVQVPKQSAVVFDLPDLL